MTLHLGMVAPGSTIYIPFDTFAGATGASITMTGLAVGDILIYKNGGTTQRGSTTGFTLLDTDGIDFDALTGIHGLSIDLSSNATADFYTAGAFYWIVISTITVDTQTVSFVLATFSIGYATALINTTIATLASQTSFTLTAGPAEDDALNGCTIVIHDIASAVQLGKAVVADYTGSTKTVTLVAGVTFTAAAGDNVSVFVPTLQPATWGRTIIVDAAGLASADVTSISGDPVAADNAESFFDGTGYGEILQRTTIATLASQTSFTLTAGSADNNAYNGCIIVIQDAATAAQKATGVINTYTGATKTVGLLANPAIFTMAVGDIVTIIADKSPTLTQVRQEMIGALTVDTYSEPGQGVPASTLDLGNKINYIYKWIRNLRKQTRSTGLLELFNDAGTVVDQKATITDDGDTTTIAELVSGP